MKNNIVVGGVPGLAAEGKKIKSREYWIEKGI